MKTHSGSPKNNQTLPKVALGKTGRQVSQLALGGFHQLEVSSEIVRQVVDAYLECGGSYIETARNYGRGASEDKIGRALEGRRDAVTLCTKTGAATADEARRDLELSLAALRTDHVDFCLLHCVPPEALPKIAAKGGAYEGLQKARQEGLVGGIGLSSHVPQVYLDAFECLELDLILVWCNYLDNLNFPIIPGKIIPQARKRGIGVTAMKPLADGLLFRSAESAVRYCLGIGPDVVVCGTNSPEQVRQIADAVRQGAATAAQREKTLKEAPELGKYVCRQCGQCPDELRDTFRMEGMFDRQMIDFLPHDPAEGALRNTLSHWFHLDKAAREDFAKSGYDVARLIAAAKEVDCPYGVDVPRKAAIATAKLKGERPELL